MIEFKREKVETINMQLNFQELYHIKNEICKK